MEDISTDPNFTWIDPYKNLSKGAKASLGTYIITVMILGTMASICGFFFEKYGGDPQKRSLLNQVNHWDFHT